MGIYPTVTKEDMIVSAKLAEQQKNQIADQIQNGISKQTHDKKLAENFEPII